MKSHKIIMSAIAMTAILLGACSQKTVSSNPSKQAIRADLAEFCRVHEGKTIIQKDDSVSCEMPHLNNKVVHEKELTKMLKEFAKIMIKGDTPQNGAVLPK